MAYYSAPHGFQFAVIASYYDGLPFGRLLFINGFNQGPFFVRATPVGHPGGFQTELNSTLDVRVARQFEFKNGVLSGYVDFFNIATHRKRLSPVQVFSAVAHSPLKHLAQHVWESAGNSRSTRALLWVM